MAAVENNVAHYRQALEWPVADRWVFCRIPVAPSTNTGGGKSPLQFATFTRLFTNGLVTRSAPAPLDTLSDAESARGQKKSSPPHPPREEFLVAKVNALESSWAKPSRVGSPVRASSCSWRISFLESTISASFGRRSAFLLFAASGYRVRYRVSPSFQLPSLSLLFIDSTRFLILIFFLPIVESILFGICKAFFPFFFFYFTFFVLELQGSSLRGEERVGMNWRFFLSLSLKNSLERNFEFVDFFKFPPLSSIKNSK